MLQYKAIGDIMEINKKYDIDKFYIGELYLYTNFANFISPYYNINQQNKIKSFKNSRAINFQQDELRKYIDWENKREYTGFLTIFYKQDDKNYICLHDGTSYRIDGTNFIENLIPINEVLPKVNTEKIPKLNISTALELFDTIFKEQTTLYNKDKHLLSEYYIANITLKETYHQEQYPESRYIYINLPHHILLEKSNLSIQTYQQEDYTNIVYRCLFLKQNQYLYNLNNHQFYNQNEYTFESLIPLKDYLQESNKSISQETVSIPKALKLFKNII